MAHQRDTIKVLCRGTASHGHSRREIARYSWSELDDVWVRSDHRASNDVFVSAGPEGIQMYPRPVFECPCGSRPVYTHDELQAKLQQAASEGKHLTV